MLKKVLLSASASALIMSAAPAMAADMTMDEIQTQLQNLAAQVQELSGVVAEQNKVIKKQEAELKAQKQASAQAMANIKPAAGNSGIKISMSPTPKIESADGEYSFQPFGRVHFDTTIVDDDKSDQSSNANIRRARLGFKGKLGKDFDYKTEIDFAGNGVTLKETSLTYKGLEDVNLKVGNQKPSFGLEQMVGASDIQFIERSATSDAFTRTEVLGGNVIAKTDGSWSLAAGVFNESPGINDNTDDEDISIDGRITANVMKWADASSDDILHIGAGVSHRRPTGNVSFRARPTGSNARFVDTGNIGSIDHVNLYNVEAAGSFGPFSLQGEYFMADVDRKAGNQDAEFDGLYAQASYFLTGESRAKAYKGSAGKFGRVKPLEKFNLSEGGTGAVELLARYENLDLNDASAGITGGELDNYTVGMNWYLSDHVRLMLNVISVDTDANAATTANDDPTIYNMRAQWDF